MLSASSSRVPRIRRRDIFSSAIMLFLDSRGSSRCGNGEKGTRVSNSPLSTPDSRLPKS